jgi:hypothetical protein
MLRFLSSLFTPAAPQAGGLDPALIDAAIERAVDGTDRRLRAVRNYRKRLRGPVERAGRHVIALVDSLPAPAEISQHAFSTDSRVRAFFSSNEHLREVLGGFRDLREYLKDCAGTLPDDIFGLLTMAMEERSVLGMELEGEVMRRDVLQVAVNFCNHRYVCPTATESDCRWELKKRAFDFLLARALERLIDQKKKRSELDRQRHLLRQKLAALQAGNWGLASIFEDTGGDQPDLPALEAQIASIDAELGQAGSGALGLEESLEHLIDTLERAEDWLAAREICLRLDHRGIKVSESSTGPSRELRLTELFTHTGLRRIVLLGRVPRAEIPGPSDFLKQARHYLA